MTNVNSRAFGNKPDIYATKFGQSFSLDKKTARFKERVFRISLSGKEFFSSPEEDLPSDSRHPVSDLRDALRPVGRIPAPSSVCPLASSASHGGRYGSNLLPGG
jgi:hypothetical protein